MVLAPVSQTAPSPARPFTLVLTGAPCAGKSSALHYIEELLKNQGFHVLKIEEVATRFFANIGGVDSMEDAPFVLVVCGLHYGLLGRFSTIVAVGHVVAVCHAVGLVPRVWSSLH